MAFTLPGRRLVLEVILSRSEAKKLCLKYYFTGTRCSHGHLDMRRVKTYTCLTCECEKTKKWAKENRDKVKAWNLKWRSNNPLLVNSYSRKSRSKNRGSALLRIEKWKKANPELFKASVRKSKSLKPQLYLSIDRASAAKSRKELKMSYLRRQIGKEKAVICITPALIEAKREQLLTARALRQVRAEIHQPHKGAINDISS